MPDGEATVAAIVEAQPWNTRVRLVQQIPEQYGQAHLAEVYSRLAQELYVPELAADFAYIHWTPDYELSAVQEPYDHAYAATGGFANVTPDDLLRCFQSWPETLRVFRLLLGFTTKELAAATAIPADAVEAKAVTNSRIRSMENGRRGPLLAMTLLAETISRGVNGDLFPDPPSSEQKIKQDRPDLARGWASVQQYAHEGVPLPMFLHQRHYGGAFGQLLNATSGKRGNMLESAVVDLLTEASIPYVQTGSSNQREIAERFNLTITPAPDFVFYDAGGSLRGLLECKHVNDGGTARDKAGRFRSLRTAADRIGGVPVFAVLSGLGWTRTRDALGPVVRECNGRVFTLTTLPEMLTVDPLP